VGLQPKLAPHKRETDLHGPLHQPVEARALGWAGFALPWRRVPPANGSDRSAHFGIDPTWTQRRLDPLEQLSIGERSLNQLRCQRAPSGTALQFFALRRSQHNHARILSSIAI
jgi:hypothetical protein